MRRAREFAEKEHIDWVLLRRARRCDDFLVKVLHHGFRAGWTRNEVVLSVLGVQKEFGLRGRLPKAWNWVNEWRLQEPSKLRLPLPPECSEALFNFAFGLACAASGWERTLWMAAAIIWRAGFDTILRPGEMAALTAGCIHFDRRGGAAVLAILAPKNRRHLGNFQFGIVGTSETSDWLKWLTVGLPPGTRIFPGSQAKLAEMFVEACKALGLSFTLGCIRPGAATARFLQDQNLGKLQYEGRWRSQFSLQHYLQMAMAKLVINRLSPEVTARIDSLAAASQLTASPPPVAASSFFGRAADARRRRVVGLFPSNAQL